MARIFFAGDVVNYTNPTGRVLGPELEAIVREADFSVCNFEAPVHSDGTAVSKSGPHHSQRRETVAGLRDQGFDLVLLANNHIMDFGANGLDATLAALDEAGLRHIGAGLDRETAHSTEVAEINGLRIGLINFAEAQYGVLDECVDDNTPGYAWVNDITVPDRVRALRRDCDFVIALCHAGLENYSVPQKYWRRKYRQLCDLGVDVVIGSHPHVPQGVERYGESLIFYSLGNLYFDSSRYRLRPDLTFSALVSLHPGRRPEYEPIIHEKQLPRDESQFCVTELSIVSSNDIVEQLNTKLGVNYGAEHARMTLAAQRTLIRAFRAATGFFPFNPDPLRAMKRMLVRKNVAHGIDLLHFVRNETYRAVIAESTKSADRSTIGKRRRQRVR